MLDWINTIAAWIAHPQVRAVLVALVISWNVTQIVKNAPHLVALPESGRRLVTRGIAFALAAIPCALLWRPISAEGFAVATAVGLAAPVIYTYGARVLYHYFPWLEPKMSAAPGGHK